MKITEDQKLELTWTLKHLMNEWNVPDMQGDKLIYETYKLVERWLFNLDSQTKQDEGEKEE